MTITHVKLLHWHAVIRCILINWQLQRRIQCCWFLFCQSTNWHWITWLDELSKWIAQVFLISYYIGVRSATYIVWNQGPLYTTVVFELRSQTCKFSGVQYLDWQAFIPQLKLLWASSIFKLKIVQASVKWPCSRWEMEGMVVNKEAIMASQLNIHDKPKNA